MEPVTVACLTRLIRLSPVRLKMPRFSGPALASSA